MSTEVKQISQTEFILWLNGATSMLDGPPTEEQWKKIRENLDVVVGGIVASKLLDEADTLVKRNEDLHAWYVRNAAAAADVFERTYTYNPQFLSGAQIVSSTM